VAVDCELEVGGGLRTEAQVHCVFEAGADFAILGTSAVRDRRLVERLTNHYREKLIVGIDAKDGMVAVEGWVETSDLRQTEFARELAHLGVSTVIATDIATDGMLTGPNLKSLRELAQAEPKLNIIASGGVKDVEDLRAIRALGLPNIIGAITGRAVYEGTLDLASAVTEMNRDAAG
jgi:phosphoribosylformimino-5-aminoimidazole carboxamide ribotide isomerase